MSMRLVLALSAVAALAGPPAAFAAPGSAVTPPAPAPRTLADRGIGTTVVQGPDVVASIFVPIPAGFSVAGGTVDLQFAHSSLLLPERSTVTVLAGDVPLASARLGPDNAAGGRLQTRLPKLADVRGGLTLTARFTMRLTRDRCEDPRNSALWAKILPTSVVAPELAPADRTLGAALADLVPGADGRLRFDLPQTPTAAELAAAGQVAAAVGRTAALTGADPLIGGPAAEAGVRDPLVRIASGTGLKTAATAPAISTPPAGAGVLAVSPTGPPALLVGGSDARGITRAAGAFASSGLTPLGGPTAVITGRRASAPAEARPWRHSAASFAQLGIGPRDVAGPGAATVDFAVDRPSDWAVGANAALHLVVDAGAALQGNGSQVTAVVGGRSVGSRQLLPGRGPVTLDFPLPAGVADTDLQGRALRSLPISLRFVLQPKVEGCTTTDTAGLRVQVLDRSWIGLPHGSTDVRDLSRFPSPLGRDDAPVAIVLPRAADGAELAAGLQAAAAFGRWQSAERRTQPRLVRAEQLTQAERSRTDLILIGRAAQEVGYGRAMPGGPLGPGTGGLVVLRSRSAADRTVLAILGDAAGLGRAARALTRAASVRQLAGSAMRVAPSADAVAVQAADGEARLPSDLIPVAGVKDKHTPRWAIPAGVALVALLLIGGLVVRRRWWGQGSTA